MENPQVSIIIVNWNAKDYLEDCITSLEKQTYQNFEIILVDNASTDDSVKFIENKFPNIRIIKNKENVGFAEGNNIGMRQAKGNLIALFNPDAKADSEWLSNLVSTLISSDKIAAVTGKIFYLGDEFGKNAVFCTWSKINPITAMPYNFFDDEPESKVDYLSGATMLVKKDVIEKIGYLDPEYFLFFDETDWCARMIRAGFDLVYTPKAKAWHKVSASLENSSKKTYYMERSRVRFAIKNFDLKYLPIFYLSFFLETLYVLSRDIKNRNFSRSKIRLKIISWNASHLKDTLKRRKNDFLKIKKLGHFKSFNSSLPLKKIKEK